MSNKGKGREESKEERIGQMLYLVVVQTLQDCTVETLGTEGEGVCGEWMIPMAIIISKLGCPSQGSAVL